LTFFILDTVLSWIETNTDLLSILYINCTEEDPKRGSKRLQTLFIIGNKKIHHNTTFGLFHHFLHARTTAEALIGNFSPSLDDLITEPSIFSYIYLVIRILYVLNDNVLPIKLNVSLTFE